MRSIVLILSCLFSNVVFTQNTSPKFSFHDEWFEKIGSKGLKVGDKVPNFSLGVVLNNHNGVKTISDLKGKLIILDFWSTGCSSCIAAFPEMKKLQVEFGDKIQIFLVNPWETEERIRQVFGKRYKGIALPDLPCIVSKKGAEVNSNPFVQYFPLRGVPYHVWIDQGGVIKLKGEKINTNLSKIKQFLEGKQISYVNSVSSVPSINNDPKALYYQQLGALKSTPVAYGSFITPFNNELEGSWGSFKVIIDTATQTKTVQFINSDLLVQLISYAFDFTQKQRRILYSPNSIYWLDNVILTKDIDSSLFTSNESFLNQNFPKDEVFIKSRYCYEQVTPLALDEEKRKSYMADDLNRYFEVNYGTKVSLLKRIIPCYILKRTSEVDKIGASKDKDIVIDQVWKDGIETDRFQNVGLSSVLDKTIRDNRSLTEFFRQNKITDGPYLILDETGWQNNHRVSMALPAAGLHNIDELRRILRDYDLDIVEESREIDFLIIQKAK